eukprot:1278143-Rhodomonas_salina.1
MVFAACTLSAGGNSGWDTPGCGRALSEPGHARVWVPRASGSLNARGISPGCGRTRRPEESARLHTNAGSSSSACSRRPSSESARLSPSHPFAQRPSQPAAISSSAPPRRCSLSGLTSGTAVPPTLG